MCTVIVYEIKIAESNLKKVCFIVRILFKKKFLLNEDNFFEIWLRKKFPKREQHKGTLRKFVVLFFVM